VFYRHNRACPPLFWRRIWAASLAFISLLFLASCSDKSTNQPGLFDVYGRMVNRPLVAGFSFAEFYIFHNGDPVTDALIMVRGDTVPMSSLEGGHYYREMDFRIGDTLDYSIDSQFGTDQGSVVIPDSVGIIRPEPSEAIFAGADYSAAWHHGDFISGYYAYFNNQNGYAARVEEIAIDTTALFRGQNIVNLGVDTFWVETLRGSFFAETAPNGLILPRGVVGAAGNFRNVDIIITSSLGKEK
jgi:hypothetical protein